MLWLIALAAAGFWGVPLLEPILARRLQRNYLGEMVPTAAGLIFVLPYAAALVARSQQIGSAQLFAVLTLFFALLGSIDDYTGDSGLKGFRAHFGGGRLSSGVVKALGGMLIAVAVASLLSENIFDLVLKAILIALGANSLNLFDARPGRALKAFFILALALYLGAPGRLGALLGLVCCAAGYFPWDLRRAVMMGDAGSNPLGAALGLSAVLTLSLRAQVVLVVVLTGFTLILERVSLSELIESNRLLRFLDQLGR